VAQQGGKHVNAKRYEDLAAQVSWRLRTTLQVKHIVLYTQSSSNGRIYALHAFQKKSKTGIKTPKSEIDLIQARLRQAAHEHARWFEHHRGN
jgi:phage-related protein